MVTRQEAQQALLDAIAQAASGESHAPSLRDLAEALAWVTSPNQPHGGSIYVSQ
jgi:hypothetical protein